LTSTFSQVEVVFGATPVWASQRDCFQELWYKSDDRDDAGKPVLTIWQLLDGKNFHVKYSDGTEFFVDRGGSQIFATWPERSTLEDAASYLIGPILGFVLRLRGIPCLHAAAIAVDDQAIAIAGASGAGKSTTAAALARLGYGILSDDIVALDVTARECIAQPGYPELCLWQDSVGAIFDSADALPQLTPNWDKRCFDLHAHGARYCSEGLPLRMVYILGARRESLSAPCIEALSPSDGMMALVANSYANKLLDVTMRAQEFSLLSKVAQQLPVRRVIPPAGLDRLAALCETIIGDFHSFNAVAA
jgi:hypothetical protein